MLTNPIPKESHGKLHKHAICCKTNGWNMGSLREVSSALQARRRKHAGDRATNFGENVSFRCSRAPTTTYGGPPPSRREARATSSLYILLNATQRCHFVISLNHPFGWLFLVTRTGNMHIPSFVNQGEALHIINSAGIVYHQHAVLYIIKPKENTR